MRIVGLLLALVFLFAAIQAGPAKSVSPFLILLCSSLPPPFPTRRFSPLDARLRFRRDGTVLRSFA
jgi:hypothetical protein